MKLLQKIFECFNQNLMSMEHFETLILKLIKKLISRKLMDQLHWNFVRFLFLWCRIRNVKIKLVTINKEISIFNKTQS